jgi:DNA-directed RNA polymerase specialized sigma24 family protein
VVRLASIGGTAGPLLPPTLPGGAQQERTLMDFTPDTLRTLAEAISSLPRGPALAFCLSRFDGLDYPTIAEWLGITTDQVERDLARALQLIDRKLCRRGL